MLPTQMNSVLVIGATSVVGRQIVAQMPGRVSVRALVRNHETAQLPPRVELLPGDLTRPETLDPHLSGIDAVFLVWTAPADTAPAVIDRIARHACRIVFLSAPLKTPHPFFQQPNPARTLAEHIERLIEDSPLQWTFLRPHIFSMNSLRWWAPQIRAGSLVRWPYLQVATAPIDERDIAAVGVRALCEEGHARMEYVLTGPQSLTQFEQISVIGEVLGRPLRIEEIAPEDAPAELAPYIPPVATRMLLNAWAAAVGLPALVTPTVDEVTGTPARTFRQWAIDNASAFQP